MKTANRWITIFLAVNESFEQMTGLKDVVGKRVTEVIPGIRQSDPELFARYGRVAATGKPEKFERFVESMKMWFHISAYSPEKGFFVTVFDNITDRKNAELSLRKSEELFSKAFHNNPAAMVISSMVERRIIDANESFARSLGVSREEIIGRMPSELMALENSKDGDFLLRTLISEGRIHKHECVIRAMSGVQRFAIFSTEIVEVAGEPRLLTIAEDITERKNTELALRKSEELFSKAFHVSPITMVISSLLDNRIIDVNKSFEESTGYSREEVLGRDFRSIGLWIDPQGAEQALQAVLTEGKYRGLEYEFLTKSGKRRIGRLSAEIAEVAGEPCVLTVAEDITERKRAEIALRRSEELFSKAFHNSPVTMVISSLADHRIIDVNETFATITGYLREEVIGQDCQGLQNLG